MKSERIREFSQYDQLPNAVTNGELTPGCLILEGGGWRGLYTQSLITVIDVFVHMNKQCTVTKDAAKIAKLIADCCNDKHQTQLERVRRAAYVVSLFCRQCQYTMSGPYYNTPYGVFIAGQYSCAGATRALGLVLDYMGIKWNHVNENKMTHQWCKVGVMPLWDKEKDSLWMLPG